ncbi:hypothetical protein CHS0354_010080 [Potamilus streckersoni]|uniref:Uncharacterized protein n=1 Tax=Potamilus streckersoni TaxID=2493646 RepID=A0AAE0VHI5_9BIVA|nr:hypothetical protein CHS0354_010080 [Potamilus streckersoni]
MGPSDVGVHLVKARSTNRHRQAPADDLNHKNNLFAKWRRRRKQDEAYWLPIKLNPACAQHAWRQTYHNHSVDDLSSDGGGNLTPARCKPNLLHFFMNNAEFLVFTCTILKFRLLAKADDTGSVY